MNNIPHYNTIQIFRIGVLVFCLINSLYLVPVLENLIGEEGYIMPRLIPEGFSLFNMLHQPGWREFYPLIVGGQVLAILFRLAGKSPRLMDILIFFFTINLFNGIYLVTNGGHRLLLIFLFLLIFMDEKIPANDSSKYASISRTLTNTSFLIARLQLCVVYLASAVFKLYGTHWMDGTALYYILNIPEFSLPWIINLPPDLNFLFITGTFITLGYQFLFPVVVWHSRLKVVFLWIGVTMHLLIGWWLGLVDFGLIMILSYLLFIEEKTAFRWRRKIGEYVKI